MANGVQRPYAPAPDECLHGWFGNRVRVNGSLDYSASVAPGWVRLQLLNTCNARGLLVAFRDGDALLPMQLLGTDNGLLAAPAALERIFLYPAERIDIALDVSGHNNVSALMQPQRFDPLPPFAAGNLPNRIRHRTGFAARAAAAVMRAREQRRCRDDTLA